MPSPKSSKPEPRPAPAWSVQGLVAGVDEAGRGPLAGPVVAAAVVLDDTRPIAGLADSKALTPRARQRLHDEIHARALCVEVACSSAQEIDEANILEATLRAMSRAVRSLRLTPAGVLVDGNRLPDLLVPAQAIVRGDALVPAISAASIIAKVRRDDWCMQAHDQYPQYGFATHKGYPTPQHLQALRRHGPCPLHRLSFSPVRQCLTDSP